MKHAYSNGIDVEYSLNFRYFHIGDAFQFHHGSNDYRNAILKEVNKEEESMVFIDLKGEFTVKRDYDRLVVEKVVKDENGETKTQTYAPEFVKMEPTYKDYDKFNCD